MKVLFFSMVLTLSTGVFADSYMDCYLSGQSDSTIGGAPRRVKFDEASGYSLNEDGKAIRNINVKELRNVVQVSFSSLKNRSVIKSQYSFNYMNCEDTSKGSATLTQTVEGFQGLKSLNTVSVYSCKCGID